MGFFSDLFGGDETKIYTTTTVTPGAVTQNLDVDVSTEPIGKAMALSSILMAKALEADREEDIAALSAIAETQGSASKNTMVVVLVAFMGLGLMMLKKRGAL